MNINKMKNAELIQEIERLRDVLTDVKTAYNYEVNLRHTMAKADAMKNTQPEQVDEYAGALNDKGELPKGQKTGDYYTPKGKAPTAKQVDTICTILATQKIQKGYKYPKVLTSYTAGKLIDFLLGMPKVYRDQTTQIRHLMEFYHVDWKTACRGVKSIEGQKAYDRLVDYYGCLPTLTYAYIARATTDWTWTLDNYLYMK